MSLLPHFHYSPPSGGSAPAWPQRPAPDRLSPRKDGFAAAVVDIVRGDVLQRISAAPVQDFTALHRLGRMVRMRGTGRARNQARGGLGAFVVPRPARSKPIRGRSCGPQVMRIVSDAGAGCSALYARDGQCVPSGILLQWVARGGPWGCRDSDLASQPMVSSGRLTRKPWSPVWMRPS